MPIDRWTTERHTAVNPVPLVCKRMVLVALLMCAMGSVALAQNVVVLQRSGELLLEQDGQLQPTAETEFEPGQKLQSGRLAEGAEPGSLTKAPPESTVVLSFALREVATLSTGASAVRVVDEQTGEPGYTLTGAVHLLIDTDAEEEEPARILRINGFRLETKSAHLFFNGWAATPSITLVEGELIPLDPAEFPPPPPDSETPKGLQPGQRLVLDPEKPRVEAAAAEEDPFQAWSLIPGFEAAGPYENVADALPNDKKLTVNRHGQDSLLTGERIPIFKGDELLTMDGQQVRVEFTNEDTIGLTGETKFKINEYLPEVQEESSLLFSLIGQMRALIKEKLMPNQMKVQTPTATIGIKGTDFEAIASEAGTEVSTVDGLLGVADADGLGEVDVPAGMTTSVAAGELPLPPTPIPPAKLQALQATSLAGGPGIPLPGAAPGGAVAGAAVAGAAAATAVPTPSAEPAAALTVTIGGGEPAISVERLGNLVVVVNRPVVSWQVSIDGEDVTANLPPDLVGGEPKAAIVIPAEFFAEMGAGAHLLTITVTDAAQATGAGNIAVILTAPPAPVAAPEAPVAEAAAPPEPEVPKGPLKPQLQENYENSVSTQTGHPIDEQYLNDRGVFGYATIERLPAGTEASGEVIFKEESTGESIRDELNDPFLEEIR
ncbi:MAG: FecR domain-containing protein [SAR324 cluster bacterium]|nr:FecR domain-containing protein [SAR324 cluster bacterium]